MTAQLIDLPETPCFSAVTISLVRVIGRTASPFSLSEQSFRWPGEQWMIDVSLPVITRPEVAALWKAFGAKMRGSYNYVLLGDPLGKTPSGVATGTPQVAAGGQTGSVLLTKGWTNSVTGIMKAGDYIQLGTGENARLHILTEDANSDGSGNATLSIEPALRSSPALNQAVIIDNPRGAFRLDSNTWSWSAAPGPKYNISFGAREVISA